MMIRKQRKRVCEYCEVSLEGEHGCRKFCRSCSEKSRAERGKEARSRWYWRNRDRIIAQRKDKLGRNAAERSCRRCGGAIPKERRWNAVYCFECSEESRKDSMRRAYRKWALKRHEEIKAAALEPPRDNDKDR